MLKRKTNTLPIVLLASLLLSSCAATGQDAPETASAPPSASSTASAATESTSAQPESDPTPLSAPLYDTEGMSYQEWSQEHGPLGSHGHTLLLAKRGTGSQIYPMDYPLKAGQRIVHSVLCPARTPYRAYLLVDGKEFGPIWSEGCNPAARFTMITPELPHDPERWAYVVEVDPEADFHAIVSIQDQADS